MVASKVTGAEKLAESLRRRILRGEFAAGAPLREEELASNYRVSRHVIREVLRRLTADGVAEYSSFRGASIPVLSRADVRDIYRGRELVECESLRAGAAELDVQKLARVHSEFAAAVLRHEWDSAFDIDVDFHSLIVSASGSKRLVKWHRQLLLSLKLAHLSAPEFQSRGLQQSVPEHADVVLSVAAGDADAASAALQRHLHNSECLLLRGLAAGAVESDSAAQEAIERI